MRINAFDYELPQELIAQRPISPRDAARLLVVRRESVAFEHHHFRDIVDYLAAGDCLVVNDTRVLAARLRGRRTRTQGRWEGLFLRETGDGCWELLCKTRGHPAIGEHFDIADGAFHLELVERSGQGTWRMRPVDAAASTPELLERFGNIPIPPYIRHGAEQPADREDYQTVYARQPGAIAAPTAGLHFTPALLDRIRAGGVDIQTVTLHVGPGTFRPVAVEDTNQHQMHAEWCELSADVAQRLNQVRAAGGRIVAVGTTSVRTLETAYCSTQRSFVPYAGETALFIVPGHDFVAVDAMITNFHLPRSTLLMLVAAFAGPCIFDAYREAVEKRYRFYSYGDAMLIH